MSTQHPDFSKLAARISISNLHKNTTKIFSDAIEAFRNYKHPKNGQPAPLIAEDVYNVVMTHKDRLNSAIIYDRDFEYDYFGFKVRQEEGGRDSVEAGRFWLCRVVLMCANPSTNFKQTLEKSYLLKMNGQVMERPQHMIMRVAIGIHKEDVDAAIETYNLMCVRTTSSSGLFRSINRAAPTSHRSTSPQQTGRSSSSRTPRPRCSTPARPARSSPPASSSP